MILLKTSEIVHEIPNIDNRCNFVYIYPFIKEDLHIPSLSSPIFISACRFEMLCLESSPVTSIAQLVTEYECHGSNATQLQMPYRYAANLYMYSVRCIYCCVAALLVSISCSA